MGIVDKDARQFIVPPVIKPDDRMQNAVDEQRFQDHVVHRPVMPEVWRGVGAFADAAAIADLARVLVEGDPLD
jgi:hypothetical protein